MFFDSIAFAMGAPAGGAEGQGNPLVGIAPLLIMFVIFYFLLIRPQQKKAKQHKELLGNLRRGDRIITSGGLYGRIEEVNADELTINLGNDVMVTVNRNYVSGLAEHQPREPKKASKKEDKE